MKILQFDSFTVGIEERLGENKKLVVSFYMGKEFLASRYIEIPGSSIKYLGSRSIKR